MGTIPLVSEQVLERLRKIGPLAIALYAILLSIYFLLRIVNISSIQGIEYAGDSASYMAVASRSLLDGAFWNGLRPFTVPLVYKLLGRLSSDPQTIGIFQSGLSMLCWSLLAISFSREVRLHWLRPIAFVTILVFSLTTDLILWDWWILSESISLSLLALFIASWLWLVRGWQWRKAAVVAIIGFFWVFSRDSNAWVILTVAAVLALIGLTMRTQRRYLVLAGLFVAFFMAYEVPSNVGEPRNYTENVRDELLALGERRDYHELDLDELLQARILPFAERTAYFEEHGMPVTPALMERSGKPVSSDNWAFLRDPALQEFRDWQYKHGKSTYVQFLLSRPLWTALEPLRCRADLLRISDLVYPYRPHGFSPILKEPLDKIVSLQLLLLWISNDWALLCLFAAGIVASLAVSIIAWRQRNAAWFAALAIVGLAYPHALLIFHGNPLDLGRHAVEMSAQLGVGLWMLLLFGIDIVLSRSDVSKPNTPTAGGLLGFFSGTIKLGERRKVLPKG